MALFLAAGATGALVAEAVYPFPIVAGGNAAALALLAAWAAPDLRAARARDYYEGDLLGTGVLAALLLAIPFVRPEESWLAGVTGAVLGLLVGLGLQRVERPSVAIEAGSKRSPEPSLRAPPCTVAEAPCFPFPVSPSPRSTGLTMTNAVVLIEAERDALSTLGGALADIEGVAEAYSVTGEWDFVAIVRVPDHEQLADVVTVEIGGLPGVLRTQTMVAFAAFSRHDLEALFSIGE